MDLVLAAILIVLLSVWALLIGLQIGSSRSQRLQVWIQLSVVGLWVVYFFCLWNRPVLTRWLPHSALIILANWHALMGSFFVGIYLSTSSIRLSRKWLLGPFTLLLSVYSIFAPFIGVAPNCDGDVTAETLVSQTTPYTCSPAAAATLLRLHGINATEAEMTRLCLTRQGTHWLGVYRGLKIMTQDSAWDVIAEPFSAEAVLRLGRTPAVLSINVGARSIVDASDYGFSDAVGHSVVALRAHPESGVAIFDPEPSYGIEAWNPDFLQHVSDGVILRLVPSGGSLPADTVALRVHQLLLAQSSTMQPSVLLTQVIRVSKRIRNQPAEDSAGLIRRKSQMVRSGRQPFDRILPATYSEPYYVWPGRPSREPHLPQNASREKKPRPESHRNRAFQKSAGPMCRPAGPPPARDGRTGSHEQLHSGALPAAE